MGTLALLRTRLGIRPYDGLDAVFPASWIDRGRLIVFIMPPNSLESSGLSRIPRITKAIHCRQAADVPQCGEVSPTRQMTFHAADRTINRLKIFIEVQGCQIKHSLSYVCFPISESLFMSLFPLSIVIKLYVGIGSLKMSVRVLLLPEPEWACSEHRSYFIVTCSDHESTPEVLASSWRGFFK